MLAPPASLARRVQHLLLHELRRQKGRTAFMWLLVLTAGVARSQGISEHLMVNGIINLAAVVLPVVITCGCMWPSSPARAEVAIHTQPVGRWALILAQSAFLLLAVVLPWVLLDILALLGFGLDAAHWFRLVLGSLLTILAPVGLSAAWMSVARTHREQGVIFLVSLIAWWSLVILFQILDYGRIFARRVPVTTETVIWTSSAIRYQVHLFGLGFLGISLWLLQTMTRRRKLVFNSAVVGLIVLLVVEIIWPWDWLFQRDPVYTGGPLHVVVADPRAGHKGETIRLWPGLEIAGLRHGEVPVVSHFRPLHLRLSTGYTDGETQNPREFFKGTDRIGVQADALRTIAAGLPEGWVCADNGALPSRLPLPMVWEMIGKKSKDDWRGQKSDPAGSPWMLRLAVVEPRLVGEFPLRDLHEGRGAFLMPGVWMFLREKVPSHGFMELELQVVSRRSMLTPAAPRFTDGAPWDRDSPQKLYLVLMNDAQRIARVELSRSVVEDFAGAPGFSIRSGHFQMPVDLEAPTNRMKLTGLTREAWISQTRVQVWWPHLKGFTVLEVPGADVRRLAGK